MGSSAPDPADACQEGASRPRIKRVGMPKIDSPARAIARNVLVVVGVFLVLYVIYLLRQPISWLIIAAFLAVALAGAGNFFQRYMKRGAAHAPPHLRPLFFPHGPRAR